MAATLDDLLYVAAALRTDIRSGLEEVVRGIESQRAGGGGAPSAQSVGGFGAGLDKFAANAQKASGALTAFTVTFDRMITGLGNGLQKFISLANPAVVIQFNLALNNAMSAMGRVLIPVMQRFTTIIQMLGNAIESLSPQSKQLIAALASGGGIAAAFGAIATAGTLLIRVLGIWPALIGAVAAAFAGLLVNTADGKQLMASFSALLKQVGSVFEEIAKALLPIVNSVAGPMLKTMGELFQQMGGVIGRVLMTLAPGLKAVGELFMAIIPVLAELNRAAMPLAEAVLVPLAAILSVVARVIADALVPVLNELAYVIRQVADFIADAVRDLMELLGLNARTPGEGGDYDPNKKQAQAVRQSSIMDLRGAMNKAYTSAYGGAAADVPKAHLEEAKKATGKLEAIDSKLGQIVSFVTSGGKTGPSAPGKIAEEGGWLGRRFRDVDEGVRRIVDPLDILGRMERNLPKLF